MIKLPKITTAHEMLKELDNRGITKPREMTAFMDGWWSAQYKNERELLAADKGLHHFEPFPEGAQDKDVAWIHEQLEKNS